MDEMNWKLSRDQQDFLRPSVTKIMEDLTELREALTTLGWGKGDFSCLICDCEVFEAPEGVPTLRCARTTCGHGFASHDVR